MDDSKELLIRIINILEKNDNNKGIYMRFIRNYIETLIFEINITKGPIFEEDSINFLYYLTTNVKHLFNSDIIEKILTISILIVTRYEYKDNIIINALKIINELLSIETVKNNNSIYARNSILFIISLKLLKECNINDNVSEVILQLLYQLVKIQNIDIYSINNFDIKNIILSNQNIFKWYGIQIQDTIDKLLYFNKIIENTNIVKLLFDYLIKSEKYNNSLNIMKIFGISDTISPSDLEQYYLINSENSSIEDYEQFILEDDELQIKRFNRLSRRRETINIAFIEPSNTEAVISLMDILKNHSQKDLKIKIILNLQLLIQSISLNQAYLIDIILPTIIKILPLYEYKYQIISFQNIILIVTNFSEKSKPYLDDIFSLINNYISKDYLETFYQLFTILFENYEYTMGQYYHQLIPKFINIIKSDIKESISYIKLLILISKNSFIYPYIKLILSELKIIIPKTTNLKFISAILDLIKKFLTYNDIYIYYPLIISIIIEKIKMSMGVINEKSENGLKYLIKNSSNADLNILIFNQFLDILKLMNEKYRKDFIIHLPKIIKSFTSCGLIDYDNCRQILKKLINGGKNFTFMYPNNFIKKISYCSINCHIGFNSFTNNISTENKKEIENGKSKDFSFIEMDIENDKNNNKKPRGSFSKKQLNIVKNRRGFVDNELVLKTFDNNNCKSEKDWNKWYKTAHNILFEQSPSNFLYIFYLLTEYYFSLNVDLTTHAFYSVYMNNNDINKAKLTQFLQRVFNKDSKAPDNLLLSILDLSEFMERKNISMIFLDYTLFGNIAYKCKALAKALFYKEKDFEKTRELNMDNLIDLYYKLNIPENGIGLINLVENNQRYADIKDYDKKYIWYINLHDYSKALKIINIKLLNEKDSNKIKNLKKYRNICLNGLCDWEQILSENESMTNIEKKNTKNTLYTNINRIINNDEDKINIEENLEYKLLLSKCCADLGEWDKLSKYVNEINQIIIEDCGKKVFIDGKKNEDLNQKNDLANNNLNEINTEINNKEKKDYIPYNDLINNNNKYLFLKYHEHLFDLYIYSSIINIKKNNFEIARKYIEGCGKMLINDIKILIKESYTRGYSILLKNQFLRQLENYIDYKQYHSEDDVYLEKIKEKLRNNNNKISKMPELYIKYLVITSLIFPFEEQFEKIIELAKIYRQSGSFEQCLIILKRLKTKMNLNINEEINDKNLLLNEKRIKIELSYNKCLYEKGNINEAVENGKYLIDLLNDEDLIPYNKLDDNIKGKIYGNYAIYRLNQLILNKHNFKILRQKSEVINRTFFRHKTNYLTQHNFFVSLFKKDNNDIKKKKQVKFNQSNIPKSQNIFISNSDKKMNINKEALKYEFIKNINEVNIINHYLTLATQYNKNSYKYWNYYAIFNYKCYKYIFNGEKDKNGNFDEENNKKLINFAFNSINGFKYCFLISNKNKVKTLQDCLKFIDIFFELGNRNKKLLSLIDLVIDNTNIEIFIGIIPQLFSRLDIKDIKILEILVKLFIKMFINYPYIIFFPLIVLKNSKRRINRSIANLILQNSFKKSEKLKDLYVEYEEFVNELNKCSILNHEEWSETIENSAKLFLNKDYNGMFNQLIKMHNKMNNSKESLYDINFYQSYGIELKEAEKYINKLLEEQNLNYLKEAWEIYQSVYNRIRENYSKFQSISLQYISSKLFNIRDSNIIMPGCFLYYYYKVYEKEMNSNIDNFDIKSQFKPVTIQRMDNYLIVLNSKQHPRKTSMIGSDCKEYLFLLKGHEDLHQDERVIQIFNLVNLIMAKDKLLSNKNLYITVYSVIPLSHKSGLIGWVHNSDTLNKLIKEQKAISNNIQNFEHNYLNKLKYDSSKLITKIDIFLEILRQTKGDELQKIIWLKSKNCESWLIRTTNYSRSLAVMSIVGYILGLGDRHLNNLLMSRKNGQIIHIDFGDCFEVAMKRDKYPEKVPFRLTRMLVKALGISEIEGIFRITCEKIMKLLRKNQDSLMAILSAIIHNPLISFRLMIPMIIKKQKRIKTINNNIENDNKSNSMIEEIGFKNITSDNDFSSTVRKIINKNKNISSSGNLILNSKEPNKEYESSTNMDKDERQIMENEKRQIFNLYEENDEFDSEELYKIAQIVLNRINDKLNGMDFYPDIQLNEKEQVDKLIKQARLTENLAQSYLGWCPFW